MIAIGLWPLLVPTAEYPRRESVRFIVLTSIAMQNRSRVAILWAGYVAFVVYGSLVPLRFVPHPLGEALARFQAMPFLRLGVESRADWVANGILYLPVGFLTAVCLGVGTGRRGRGLAVVLAAGFGLILATAVEFAQIFFPPRSVILNDLLAEGLGTLLGIAVAAGFSGWFRKIIASLGAALEGRQLGLLLQAYGAAYLFFALFPFDLLVSWSELERKANSGMWGWWVASEAGGNFQFLVRLFVDVLMAIPVGWALAARQPSVGLGAVAAGTAGFGLGAMIEIAQFFLASGISQGVSVMTRALGVILGAVTWQHRSDLAATLRGMPGVLKAGIWLLYGAILLTLNGWFASVWEGSGVSARLGEVNFLPFYYHYYTTEAKALYSLATVSLMYAPLGSLVWLSGGSALGAAFWGTIAAVVVEVGKLFLRGAHPDPTNLLIAAVASALAVALARMFMERVSTAEAPIMEPDRRKAVDQKRGSEAEESVTVAASGGRGTQGRQGSRRGRRRNGEVGRLGAVAVLSIYVFLVWKLALFPSFPLVLGLGIATAGIAVWTRPLAVFFIIPALLPVFDLAPWSGRFYWDEFDFLIVALTSIAYLRTSPAPSRRRAPDGPLWAALGLLAASISISTAIGLHGVSTLDLNAFNSYYSAANAVRIAKGFLWALVLLLIFRRVRSEGEDPRGALAWGMVVGLGLSVLVILWERLTFTGLFNFNADYRATGPFSALHVGGAYIEAFLSAAVPFLAALLLQRQMLWVRVAGVGLLAAATYALMVTYSRNGYTAYGVALAVVFALGAWSWEFRWRRFILPVLLGCAVLGAGLPVLLGGFAQERFAHVGRDLGLRQAHWLDSLGMRDDGLVTTLFGMGVGRFPETAYWRSQGQKRSGAYRLEEEGGNVFLRLTPGESIYMEQFVSLRPGTEYLLTADLRARRADAQFTFPICQKWMLASYECVWKTVKVGDTPDAWQHHEVSFNSGILGSGPWYAKRPVKLSLYNSNSASQVDVDNVTLKPVGGDEELAQNGNFSDGLDHWFFSTDSHLQWHAKSLPIAIVFDQGVLGLCAWTLLIGLAVMRLARSAFSGDILSAALVGSIAAIVTVGLFDTVIDSPRFLLLLALLAGVGALRAPAGRRNPVPSA